MSVSAEPMFSKLNPLNWRSQKEPTGPKRKRRGSFMRLWRRSSSSSPEAHQHHHHSKAKVVTRSQLTRHSISASQALSQGNHSPKRRTSSGSRREVRSNDLLTSDFLLPLDVGVSQKS
ncbi:hypothetical protein ACI3LY_002047 [Candidozyma auris]|nr:hypothetical protein CJI97_002790 [[Candida] auris]